MDVWKVGENYVTENIRINPIISLNLDKDASSKKHQYQEMHIIINRTLKWKVKKETPTK
jgi:hypothetical protein